MCLVLEIISRSLILFIIYFVLSVLLILILYVLPLYDLPVQRNIKIEN